MAPRVRKIVVVATNPGRPLDTEPPKRQASKRPGQQPPRNQPGQQRQRNAPSCTETGSYYVEWGVRQQRKHDAWAGRRREDEEILLVTEELRAGLLAERREAELQRVQALLDRTEPLRCWGSAAADGTPCCFSKTGSEQAVYHGLGGVAGSIDVPIYNCTSHGKPSVKAHPFQIGCVPTSPEVNTIYLSEELVDNFRLLQLKDGVGGHAFIIVHNLMAKRFDPHYGLQLNDEVLQEAAHNLGAWGSSVAERVRCAQLADAFDPFGHCPICAFTSRRALNDGTALMPYIPSAMADACTKACRFESAGSSQPQLPIVNTFLAGTSRKTSDDVAAGVLTSKAQERWAEECADASAGGVCSSNLTCSRPSASTTGALHYSGLAGVFCPHNFAAQDGVLAMRTPEQHQYHNRTFSSVIHRRPDIKHLYIDIACRYKGSLLAALQPSVDAGNLPPKFLDELLVMVPFMHAFDHDQDCQLKYSGLYQKGVGHRVGEQSEQVWSQIKPFALIARYMTQAHWWQGYNLVFELLSRLKQGALPELLDKKMRNTHTAIDQHNKSIEQLKAEAGGAGVPDLEAALASLRTRVAAADVDVSEEERYVEALMKLRVHEAMRDMMTDMTMVLDKSVGLNVRAKALDTRREEKLRNLVVAFESSHNFPLGRRWAKGDEEFDATARLVARRACAAEAGLIKDMVFKMSLIKQDKGLETGNPAIKLRKQMIKLHSKIEQHMQLYLEWLALYNGGEASSLTQEIKQQVFKGEYMWLDANDGSSTPAARHFGQRYRQLCAQRDRCIEEGDILKSEMLRLCNGLEERTAALQAAIEELASSADSDGTPVTWLAQLNTGTAAALRAELLRLQIIQTNAIKLRTKHSL